MKDTFTPSERRVHYEDAVGILKENLVRGGSHLERYGLCILLGEIAYGNFWRAPWSCFYDRVDSLGQVFEGGLVSYFPELTKPLTKLGELKEEAQREAITERISILEEAIKIIDQTSYYEKV